MSFINFNNRTAPEAGTYSARMIAEALYQVETKNINRIKSLVESIKEPLATAEALKMFENKLVALNALQTAAANAMPVNEGQFSWMTQDTGEQIGSERENRITVYMYDNEGNQYKEAKYDGYGEFGGMDYYELLARMNGYTEEDLEEVKGPFKEMRQLGIDVAFDKLPTKDKGKKVLYPALVTDPRYNWKKHDFTQEAESDPDQSWYVEPEYDEEYYEAQKVEEAKSIAKIQKEWAKVTAMMKDTVDKWKAAEGQEKEDLLTQLKTLTISKKKLEVELDDAVGLKDADAELVGEAKNEIKYYKTISKKDWEKAPKDYKSTIDGEHYMMFLDDKLGSILAPVKVEEAYTEDDINTGYGFYGTINMEEDDKTTQQLFDRSVKDLMKEFKISEEAALAVLNSKMGRKAADQIIDGQSKTAVDALKDYYGKTLKKEMDKVIAANEGLTWDSLIEKVKNVTEDWGSSDQSIMNKAIHKDAGSPKKMPSPFDSKLRAAAEDAVDFYWDDWEEYETDRQGLIDNAIRGYLRSYFRKDWDLLVKMFETVDERVGPAAKGFGKEVTSSDWKTWKGIAKAMESKWGDIFSQSGKPAVHPKFVAYYIHKKFDLISGGKDAEKTDPLSVKNITDFLKWYKMDTKVFMEWWNKTLDGSNVVWDRSDEAAVTEAKFVKDFNRDVLKAKTKEEVLELYPNAQFFIGKSDHFFGELDGNLFFKAYYTKAQEEFEIKSVYSEKGSNYVHLYNESVVTEAKYDKKKLLKLIKNQDDAEILVDGKWYIIYNPDNGNDENTEMWAADDYIYALDPDGEEYQIKYKDIEQFKESVEVTESETLSDYEEALAKAKEIGVPIAMAMATIVSVGVAGTIALFKKGVRSYQKWANANLEESFVNLLDEQAGGEVNEADINDPVLVAFRAARTKREKELAKPKRKPLYGKQREKAEDDLWQISQDLKDLYADRGQMLIDMEQEAEVEGGPIADEYGDKLNKIEDEIQKLIAKRSKLEMRLAESFINEEEDYSDEMTYGQLERCIDYATMLRERYEGGFSFDPWMHSAVTTAKNELNSVFDALDGGDGVVEKFELTEGVMSDIHQMAGEVKDEEEFVKQFFKEYGAKVKKNPESVEWVKSLYADTVKESVVNEAKKLDRDEMMDWLDQTLSFTRTSEEFDGAKGGIWTTGENGEEWKGKVIYAYYSEDYKNRTFGVLNSWEKELNKRGWYSEWYDAGTVMIWPN